jgi:hypothetical protein
MNTAVRYPYLFDLFKEGLRKSIWVEAFALANLIGGCLMGLYILGGSSLGLILLGSILFLGGGLLIAKMVAVKVAQRHPEVAWEKTLSRLEATPIRHYLPELNGEIGFSQAIEWTQILLTDNYLLIIPNLHQGAITHIKDITSVYLLDERRGPIHRKRILCVVSRVAGELMLTSDPIEIKDIVRELRLRTDVPLSDELRELWFKGYENI